MNKAAAYTQLAAWVQKNHPEVFAAWVDIANRQTQLGLIYRSRLFSARESQKLGDYSDYIADIGEAAGDIADDSSFYSAIDDLDIGAADSSLLDNLDDSGSIANDVSAETAIADANPLTTSIDVGSTPDITTSIPTSVTAAPSSAAASVGSTLAANSTLITTALKAASTILSANAAASVIAAQAQRAAAGLAPANVGYVTSTNPLTGQVTATPVLNTANGQLPLTGSGIDALSPSTFLQNYGLYIMLGLAALVVATE